MTNSHANPSHQIVLRRLGSRRHLSVGAGSSGASADSSSPLTLHTNNAYSGFRAVRMLFLLNPITYFLLACSIAAFGDLPAGQAALYRRLIVAIGLVMLMPPLAWIADMLTGGPQGPATVSSAAPASYRATGAEDKA